MSQTEIPVDEGPAPIEGPCAWCGEPAVARIQIEKARFGLAHNGVRVMKKRPIEALVCAAHEARFATEED